MTLEDIDIFDPDLYANRVPHERFELLRREAPVFWHEEPDGPGFWAVTKHSDVLAVSKDAETFSSEIGGTMIVDLPKEDMRRSPDMLATMDPPKHTRYRALIGQSFTGQELSRTQPFIKRLVARLLDELIERGRFEFMHDLATRLPTSIIFDMVGVPNEDQEMLNAWVVQLLAPDDAEYATSIEERAATTRRFIEYAHALAAERRRAPTDDLLSRLMQAEVDGVKLTYEEFGMFFILLVGAGTHTSSLTLGNGILTLLEHPELRVRLRENPDLMTSAVEEILRFTPPLLNFRRTAKRDTEIRGQKVLAGQKVVVWYVSANRDEDVFVNPHRFEITRSPNDHISFGYGPHFCVGNALARMSIRIALQECVRRMPEPELDGPVERLRSNWFNGMKRIPFAVGPGARR